MLQNYFRDINDHVKLVHDEIGSQRELLTSILQANLALLGVRQNEISVQQNETSKQLTLVATIFLPLSFITGFFGMNFPWLVDHIGSFGRSPSTASAACCSPAPLSTPGSGAAATSSSSGISQQASAR